MRLVTLLDWVRRARYSSISDCRRAESWEAVSYTHLTLPTKA